MYLIQNLESDLMVTCEEIMLLQVCIIVVLKLNLFMSHRDQMYALVRAFQNTQKCVKPHEFPRFVKCNRIHAKLIKLYVIGTTIVAILFPYDYQQPVVFALSLVYNIDTMGMTMFISVTVDTCYSEMANNLAIHFDLVRQRYEQLDLSVEPVLAVQQLVEVISYHSEVLDLAQKMVRLFQQLVFYLLLLISTILCVLGYEFVMYSNIYKALQVLMMASVMVGQAVIYTYNGSIIRERILSSSGSYITMLMSLESDN
uniref:Odorant receptor n=1 Tax=Anopheles farauti TaxID=69004 RepID=A0A182Q581_9DIPT